MTGQVGRVHGHDHDLRPAKFNMSEGKVVVKVKTGGDCIRTRPTPIPLYDAHKGQGYQVPITETCSPENEVQLITAARRRVPRSPTARRWCRCSTAQRFELLPEGCWPTRSTAATRRAGHRGALRAAEGRTSTPGREPASDPLGVTLDSFAGGPRDQTGGERLHGKGTPPWW